ncbi:MAG: biotin carboxylase, partial [Flavobacteriales bacterium]|nr:biotin carboxylase [Flavobacteriales bacterium]
VEHPVTEMISGVDLVKQQICVARGEKLAFSQQDLKITGHALEIRVYAEDPKNNFLPDIGKLEVYDKPSGSGVRVDDGFEQGMEIPIYYDPMISKLIVHADNRQEAIARMTRAIDEYTISPIATTLSFCRFAINHPSFVAGDFDTNFVAEHFKPAYLESQSSSDEAELAAILGSWRISQEKPSLPKKNTAVSASNWRSNRTAH